MSYKNHKKCFIKMLALKLKGPAVPPVIVAVILGLLLGVTLSGCGQLGPLYLREAAQSP